MLLLFIQMSSFVWTKKLKRESGFIGINLFYMFENKSTFDRRVKATCCTLVKAERSDKGDEKIPSNYFTLLNTLPKRFCFWNTLKGRRVVTNRLKNHRHAALLSALSFFSRFGRLMKMLTNRTESLLSVINDH